MTVDLRMTVPSQTTLDDQFDLHIRLMQTKAHEHHEIHLVLHVVMKA